MNQKPQQIAAQWIADGKEIRPVNAYEPFLHNGFYSHRNAYYLRFEKECLKHTYPCELQPDTYEGKDLKFVWQWNDGSGWIDSRDQNHAADFSTWNDKLKNLDEENIETRIIIVADKEAGREETKQDNAIKVAAEKYTSAYYAASEEDNSIAYQAFIAGAKYRQSLEETKQADIPCTHPFTKVVNDKIICSVCGIETKQVDAVKTADFTTAIKSGRAFNGFEKDRGTIVHLVEPLPKNTGGYWGGKALCGVEPGSRGNGWHYVKRDVSCKGCISKSKVKKTPEQMIDANPPVMMGDVSYLMQKYADQQTASLQSRIEELETKLHISIEQGMHLVADKVRLLGEKRQLETALTSAGERQMYAIVNFEAIDAQGTIVATYWSKEQAYEILEKMEDDSEERDDNLPYIYAGEVIEIPLPLPPTSKQN